MTESNGAARRAGTMLSLAALRADALHRTLLARRDDVRTPDDISGLGELWSWSSEQIEAAICDLIADGRLADDAHGQLIMRRHTA
jgi:hypothetical protein